MKTTCPTCGSQVQITNGTTNHFIPIDLDQEKEKVAVAFAEWKDKKTYIVNSSSIFLTSEGSVSFDNYSDLYQYFINNVYNK